MATVTALPGVGGFVSSDANNSLTWSDKNAVYDLWLHSAVAGIATLNDSSDVFLFEIGVPMQFTVRGLTTLATSSGGGQVMCNWVKQ